MIVNKRMARIQLFSLSHDIIVKRLRVADNAISLDFLKRDLRKLVIAIMVTVVIRDRRRIDDSGFDAGIEAARKIEAVIAVLAVKERENRVRGSRSAGRSVLTVT